MVAANLLTVWTDNGIISIASRSIFISTKNMENNIDDLIQIGSGTGLFLCILACALLSALTKKQSVKCLGLSYDHFQSQLWDFCAWWIGVESFSFNCVKTEQAWKVGEAVQRNVPCQNLDHCFMHLGGSWRSSSSSFNYWLCNVAVTPQSWVRYLSFSDSVCLIC